MHGWISGLIVSVLRGGAMFTQTSFVRHSADWKLRAFLRTDSQVFEFLSKHILLMFHAPFVRGSTAWLHKNECTVKLH